MPANAVAIVQFDCGYNTTVTTATSISTVDIAIFVDGVQLTNGGWRRVSAFNPSATAVNSTGQTVSLTSIQALAAGSHTIDVRAQYVIGSTCSVASNNTNARVGSLNITILKLG